ncbi:MAG: 2-oxoisovalerate dehydrogenase [Candidatus Omnitrophica bacterium]|nr:2-oxoisovalerate dehydrogenase [Candidatus Omnitrophota bacterium]
MQEVMFVVEEAPEGGYIAKGVGVSIFTEADTLEELRRQIVDAVRCHYSGQSSSPRLVRLHHVKDEIIAA